MTDPQNVWILDFMENPISNNGNNTADFGATPRSFVTGVICFTMAAAWSKKSQQPSSPRLLSSGSFRTNVPTISLEDHGEDVCLVPWGKKRQ